MAKKNKIPDSVVNAPKQLWAYAEDEDGNPIKFEGMNRAQRRAQGMWNYNENNDKRGWHHRAMPKKPLKEE